jgi:hypothetical protein
VALDLGVTVGERDRRPPLGDVSSALESGHLIARQTILDSSGVIVKDCAMALLSEVSDS